MDISCLTNNLLIASLKNSAFQQSVIYICDHHEQGCVGLIINQPLQFQLKVLFDQLNIKKPAQDKSNIPLMYGGPLQTDRGFVVHRQMEHLWRSSLMIVNEVNITTSFDIIKAIARNEGPSDILVTLGYTSWSSKQLEQEIAEDFWLVSPFKVEILYDVPIEKRWYYAGSLIGVDMNKFSSCGSGHT